MMRAREINGHEDIVEWFRVFKVNEALRQHVVKPAYVPQPTHVPPPVEPPQVFPASGWGPPPPVTSSFVHGGWD